MTIQQDYGFKPHVETSFGSTGVFGPNPLVSNMVSNLRVVIENVGAGNTVIVKGRLQGQSSWVTLATITGASTGVTVDVSTSDETQFECTAFQASGGTPRLVASGFFRRPGTPDLTDATNLGSGEELYAGKTGNTLEFKTLTAGTGIALTPSASEVEISSTGTATSALRLSVVYNTDAFTAPGDLVRVTATDYVETITDNSDTTIPNGIFGVAFSKPTNTTVEVVFLGVIGGFSGFTPGQALYISTLGIPTHTAPATGTLQSIGFAVSPTEFFLQIGTAIRRA